MKEVHNWVHRLWIFLFLLPFSIRSGIEFILPPNTFVAGARYELPKYVLSEPKNLIRDSWNLRILIPCICSIWRKFLYIIPFDMFKLILVLETINLREMTIVFVLVNYRENDSTWKVNHNSKYLQYNQRNGYNSQVVIMHYAT